MAIFGQVLLLSLCLLFSRIDCNIIKEKTLQTETVTERQPRKTIEIIQHEDEDEGQSLDCKAPPTVPCGKYIGTNFKIGGNLTLQCYPGCHLVGNPEIRCIGVPSPFHKMVIWDSFSGTLPTCRSDMNFKDLVCNAPPEVSCGSYIGTNYKMGGNLTLQCDPACQLEGDPVIHCLAVPSPFHPTVIWDSFSGKFPTCLRVVKRSETLYSIKGLQKMSNLQPQEESNVVDEPPSPPLRIEDGPSIEYMKNVKDGFHESESEIKCQQNKEICQLEVKVGKCKARLPRYYYDHVHKKCTRFFYGGCQGNKNNFKTIEECEKICNC